MENENNTAPATKKKKARKKRVTTFFKDFKTFMSKGNVLNLAVAFVMGGAFNAIITSLANDLLMPVIGVFLGKSNLEEWVLKINGTDFFYGKFLFAIVNFLIISFTLFIIIKVVTSAENNLTKLQKMAKKQRKLFKKGLVDTPEVPPEAITATTPPPPPAETVEDLLKDIRRLLQAQAAAPDSSEKENSDGEEK